MTSVAKWSQFFEEYQLGIVCFIMLTFTWYQQTLFGFDFYIGYLTVPITIGLLANKPFKLFTMNKKLALFVVIFVTYNLFALYNSPSNLFLLKSLVSMVIFIFFVVIIFNYTTQLKNEHWERLPRSMFYTLAIFCFISFVSFLSPYSFDLKKGYLTNQLFYGFFSEPSYFVSFSFLAFVLSVNTKQLKIRFFSYIIWIIIGILSFNSTYIALTAAYLFYIIFKRSIFFGIVLFFVFLLWIIIDINYLNQIENFMPGLYLRLTSFFVFFNPNIETVALYLPQAILDTKNALLTSNFIGTGFNTMGSLPREPGLILEALSEKWPGVNQNYTDGSFLYAKLIYEMGFLAIIFILVCFCYVFKTLSTINSSFKCQITSSLIFGLQALFLIRSGVYFHYLIGLVCIPSIINFFNNIFINHTRVE